MGLVGRHLHPLQHTDIGFLSGSDRLVREVPAAVHLRRRPTRLGEYHDCLGAERTDFGSRRTERYREGFYGTDADAIGAARDAGRTLADAAQ